MNLVERMVDAFIFTMGITPPTPRTRHIATVFISCGVGLCALALLIFFVILLRHMVGH